MSGGGQYLQPQSISGNKKIAGGSGVGKIKKGKQNSTNDKPPPVGFEELSSIHPGHD